MDVLLLICGVTRLRSASMHSKVRWYRVSFSYSQQEKLAQRSQAPPAVIHTLTMHLVATWSTAKPDHVHSTSASNRNQTRCCYKLTAQRAFSANVEEHEKTRFLSARNTQSLAHQKHLLHTNTELQKKQNGTSISRYEN